MSDAEGDVVEAVPHDVAELPAGWSPAELRCSLHHGDLRPGPCQSVGEGQTDDAAADDRPVLAAPAPGSLGRRQEAGR